MNILISILLLIIFSETSLAHAQLSVSDEIEMEKWGYFQHKDDCIELAASHREAFKKAQRLVSLGEKEYFVHLDGSLYVKDAKKSPRFFLPDNEISRVRGLVVFQGFLFALLDGGDVSVKTAPDNYPKDRVWFTVQQGVVNIVATPSNLYMQSSGQLLALPPRSQLAAPVRERKSKARGSAFFRWPLYNGSSPVQFVILPQTITRLYSDGESGFIQLFSRELIQLP